MLAATVGLGAPGWAAGFVYSFGLSVLTCQAMHTARRTALGPADRVTLARAMLTGCVAALTADALLHETPSGVLVAIAIVALALDAVDGRVARHTGTTSAFGARFDMETDAFLILVLSVYAARSVGLWVLSIGAMRYAYVAASWALPWLRGQLFPRYWRKVVAAIQGIALTVAAADVLAQPLTVTVLAVALVLLTESFGRDVVWLWHRRAAPAHAGRPAPGTRPRPAQAAPGPARHSRRARA
ncbi:CDP-alcohol phosphatidyltransferase family protein [Catellatospora sp. NPDC049609]|uniref:CDP-alcohol phosphatidyltransferase family protein n=1 Tax=Catellatospora sp. NPDC049609 TaxID=3155505 RepID=UPI003424CDD2